MMKSLLAAAVPGAVASSVAAETPRTVLHKVLASPLVDEGSEPDGCAPAVSGLGGPALWQVRVERLLLDGKALVETSAQAEPNLPLPDPVWSAGVASLFRGHISWPYARGFRGRCLFRRNRARPSRVRVEKPNGEGR